METSPPLLDYAPPLPRLAPTRRVLRWMIFVLTIITVLVVISHAWQTQLTKWKRRQAVNAMLQAQDDCLRYTIPAGRMVFDGSTGSNSPPAAYYQLVKTLGPSFDLGSLGFSIGGGVLFMHEIVSPVGLRVLMIVNLHQPLPGETTYMLRCYQVDLGDSGRPSEIARVSCPLTLDPMPFTCVRGYAGRTVDGDPSRFTLPLSISGKPLTIRCAMRADRTIDFRATDGVLVANDDPREGARLYLDRLPTPDELLDTH